MTQPQVWMLIGVFAASMFGVIGIVATLFTRVIRSEVGSLHGEMNARFATLDRDVQGLTARVFRDGLD